MKTPEEIKKGLAACSADECHGQHEGCTYQDQFFCTMRMCGDALAYIQQLESTVSQVSKALCAKENATLGELLQAVDQLKSRLAQVERERDALAYEARGCSSCVHRNCDPDEPPCNVCVQDGSEYEWRGVCEENTKEEPQT